MTGFAFQQRLRIGKQPDGSYLISTGQTLTPLGTVTTVDYQRPKEVVLSPDKQHLAVLAHRRLIVTGLDGKPVSDLAITAGPLGVAWSPSGNRIYASASAGKVLVADWSGTKLTKVKDLAVDGNVEEEKRTTKDPHLAGLAISKDGATLYCAMTTRNAIAVVNAEEGTVQKIVATGVAPYHIELAPDGKTLAVANRGGRRLTAPENQMDPNTGKPFEGISVPNALSAGTPVQVDPTTDAAWRGTVSLIDTEDWDSREVSVGRQPSGMCFSEDGKTLYVAESDSDSVSFLDVPVARVKGNLSIRPKEDPQFGQMPTDVALQNDRLYVTLGGLNAVGVIDLHGSPKVAGYIPTGWYPITLAATQDLLLVASTKGIGSQPSNKDTAFGVHDSVGMLQAIPFADFANLPEQTKRVANNNHWYDTPAARAKTAAVPVPQRVGEPSVFKHVVYIIKENLTYDSAMGDIAGGNGDPSLCTFPENVTPNHHALAREFVLLDNFYTSGTNSADGHQWVSSSIANAYDEQNYASNVRSYPYDGGDPLAYSPTGFLWTAAAKAKKSVRVFGEFVNRPKILNPKTGKEPTFLEAWEDYKSGKNEMIIEAHTDNAALRPFLNPTYIGFPSEISDQWRADQFLKEFGQWEAKGEMPNLSIMLLPNNHTSGTSPGMPTPRASVADNDLALGRIVEAISQSRFWKDTLILVMEDDSQTGVDHIDGHRSVAFCISPYTRRGVTVSDMVNHTSFVRTMGLVLGIPPLNRFDRTGKPLTSCFTDKPDFRPYTARPTNIPLDEMNPPAKKLTGIQRELAIACEKLDWSDVDRAHAETVAKAIWYAQKPNTPFPSHYFHPPLDQEEDDE
jgi:DNA-binding beta-propeller fold protein YncE